MKKSILMLTSLLFLCGAISLFNKFQYGGESEQNIYSREVIHFDSGHFKIVGDLHIPNPKKKQPAILFVHGDGPARRSPSGRPNRIMRSFLDIGFACFFYDKPGYGESTGKFTSGKLFEERASILVDAVKVLKKHQAINPEQIGLWGISQAGYVMPKAIAMTKDIAFMIAISCPAMDSVDQSAYLVEKQILCEGYGEAEAKKTRQYYRQRARAKTYKEYLEAAEYLDQNPVVSSFLKWGGIRPEDQFSPRPPSHQAFFNPITLVEKITIPVLAIFGEKDTQIDPFQGADVWEKALKKARNRFYQVKLFPEADHGIINSKTGCLKEQRERYRSNYAPGYIELMQTWLESLRSKFSPDFYPWKVHEIAKDFELLDVWEFPILADKTRNQDFSLFLKVMQQPPKKSISRFFSIRYLIARFLTSLRVYLGEISGLDKNVNSLPIPGCKETSLKDRLSLEDQKKSLAETSDRGVDNNGIWRTVYLFGNEMLTELSNDTVHALMHFGWVHKSGNYFTARLAVYAKPRGNLGAFYMKLIMPFRQMIVYPALMEDIKNRWEEYNK